MGLRAEEEEEEAMTYIVDQLRERKKIEHFERDVGERDIWPESSLKYEGWKWIKMGVKWEL